jgi:hypothetical protein
MIRDIELGHLMEDFGIVMRSLKSMGEAFRNTQRLGVVSRQYHCEALLERRRSAAKSYNGVENRTASAAYELHFFMRGSLKSLRTDIAAWLGGCEGKKIFWRIARMCCE